MATFNIKSAIITNRDATPKVLTDSYLQGGELKSFFGRVTTGAADGVGSIYRMGHVPSNARISSIRMGNDALATGCTLGVGVYYPTFIPAGAGLAQSLASTVIGTTFFASAVAASDVTALTDITNESLLFTLAKQEKCLWEALGLTSDPGIDLDICITVAGAVAAAGDIGLHCSYAI